MESAWLERAHNLGNLSALLFDEAVEFRRRAAAGGYADLLQSFANHRIGGDLPDIRSNLVSETGRHITPAEEARYRVEGKVGIARLRCSWKVRSRRNAMAVDESEQPDLSGMRVHQQRCEARRDGADSPLRDIDECLVEVAIGGLNHLAAGRFLKSGESIVR